MPITVWYAEEVVMLGLSVLVAFHLQGCGLAAVGGVFKYTAFKVVLNHEKQPE